MDLMFFINLGFLILGVYLYLLFKGIIKPASPQQKERLDYLQSGYGRIIRIGLLLMMAILVANLLIPVQN